MGRNAEDRLNFCFGLTEMAMELRISAIQREIGGTRDEALRLYRLEWDRGSRRKVEDWKASLPSRPD